MPSDDLQRKLDLSESIRKDLIRKLRDIQYKYQLGEPTFQEESKHQKEVRNLKQWVASLEDYNEVLKTEVERLNAEIEHQRKLSSQLKRPILAVQSFLQKVVSRFAEKKAKRIVPSKIHKEFVPAHEGISGSLPLKSDSTSTFSDPWIAQGIDSLSVQVVVLSRSCEMDMQSLQCFAELIGQCKHLLCPELTTETMALLELCAERAVRVTVFAGESGANVFVHPDFKIHAQEFEEWLMEATEEQRIPLAFDAVLINDQNAGRFLSALRGRLRLQTKLFVVGSGELEGLNFGSSDRQTENLQIYEKLPDGWQAPFVEPSRDQWPWISYPTSHQATLPSGRPWPKISIVTATYNQGAFLEQTIRSVLLQNYPNLEYIVIDGGSTDDTSTILNRYDQELSYCISEKDKGQSDALNKGFQQSTGEILAWLNSDDRYLPGTLTRIAMAFDKYQSDMIAGGCLLIEGDAPQSYSRHHPSLPVGEIVSLSLDKLLDIDGGWYQSDFFFQPEVFWTRQLWERSGSHVDEALYYSMDYELWLRMATQKAQIVHILDPLVLFRMHDQQKTHGGISTFDAELRQVRERFLQKIQPL